MTETKTTISAFYQSVGVSRKVWSKNKEDVLDWLSNFFEYEILNNTYVLIKKQIAEVQPYPRKSKCKKEEMEKFYKFIAAMGIKDATSQTAVYKPVSVIAREYKDYIQAHTSHKLSTAEVYLRKAMKEIAVVDKKDSKWVWVNKDTSLCEPLTDAEVDELFSCNKLTQEEAVEVCSEILAMTNKNRTTALSYAGLKEMLDNIHDAAMRAFPYAIKAMIEKHPERNATYIVKTVGKLKNEDGYILDADSYKLYMDFLAGLI